jgi:hypothetical protein
MVSRAVGHPQFGFIAMLVVCILDNTRKLLCERRHVIIWHRAWKRYSGAPANHDPIEAISKPIPKIGRGGQLVELALSDVRHDSDVWVASNDLFPLG